MNDLNLTFAIADFALHHLQPLRIVEHRRFARIGRDANDQPINQLRTAPDDIHMAQCNRVECAGINAHPSRLHQCVLSIAKCAIARSISASSPKSRR